METWSHAPSKAVAHPGTYFLTAGRSFRATIGRIKYGNIAVYDDF